MDLDLELGAIAAGDAEAFGRWLSSAERPLRESLRPFARVVDTEAVLQEALLSVWQTAPRVQADGRPNALLRFGMRVVRNAAISEARRRREKVSEDDLPIDGPVEAAPPDPLLRERIQICLKALRDKPLSVLLARLHAHGGEDDYVLAERLQMRLNTFLQNFVRARRALEECLQRAGVEL